MMKIKGVFFALSVCLLISACESKPTIEPTVYADVELSLDKGKKWQVPSGMASYMDSSFVLISEMKTSRKVSTQNAEALYSFKNAFVSNCTMKEEGHEILHLWLIPYIGILDDMEIAETDLEKERSLVEIIEAKRIYKEYFN
jgi:hypothetical protein